MPAEIQYWYRGAYFPFQVIPTHDTFLKLPEYISTPTTLTLRSIKFTLVPNSHNPPNDCSMSKGGVRDAWDDDWESLADVRNTHA